MKRHFRLCLAILLFALLPAYMGNPSVIIDPKVLSVLETSEWVDVSIVLRAPSDVWNTSLKSRQTEVYEIQERVLKGFDPAWFQLKFRYVLLYGFAGRINREGLTYLSEHPDVERVYLDEPLSLFLAQGVPQMRADELHIAGIKGKTQTVAIIDTGIDYTHPDLGGCLGQGCKVLGGYDFINNDPDPMDESGASGHGTAVAGIVASTNSVNKGVAPEAKLVGLKVCDSRGCSGSAIDMALDWVLQNQKIYGITVINMSLGSGDVYSDENEFPCSFSTTSRAIADLALFGVVTVVASGNCARADGISSPACVPEAIAVGAVYDATFGQLHWRGEGTCNDCTDNTPQPDVVNCYTNSAPILDLMAPSYKATTTKSGGGAYDGFAGTSAASPYAAGGVALILEATSNGITPAELRALVQSTGVTVLDPKNGLFFPRIDVAKAVENLPKRCNGQTLNPIPLDSVPLGEANGNFSAITVGQGSPDPGSANVVIHLFDPPTDLNESTGQSSEYESAPGIPVFQVLMGNLTSQGDIFVFIAQKSVNSVPVIDLENPSATPLNLGGVHAIAKWYPNGSFFSTPNEPTATSIGGKVTFCETEEGVGGHVTGTLEAIFPIKNYPPVAEEDVSVSRLRSNFEAVISTPAEDGVNLGLGNGIANLDTLILNVNLMPVSAVLQQGKLKITTHNSDDHPVFELTIPVSEIAPGVSVPINTSTVTLAAWKTGSDYRQGILPIATGVSGIVTFDAQGAGKASGERIAAEIRATIEFDDIGGETSAETQITTTDVSTEETTGGVSSDLSFTTADETTSQSSATTTGGTSEEITGGETAASTQTTPADSTDDSTPQTASETASESSVPSLEETTGGLSIASSESSSESSTLHSTGGTGPGSSSDTSSAAFTQTSTDISSSEPSAQSTSAQETTDRTQSFSEAETETTDDPADEGGCGGCTAQSNPSPNGSGISFLILFISMIAKRRSQR